MYQTNPSVLSVMQANGDGDKKISVQRMARSPEPHPEPRQKPSRLLWVTQLYTEIEGFPWAGPLFWYDYQDDCSDTTTQKITLTGLLNYDGTPKLSFAAYANVPGL